MAKPKPKFAVSEINDLRAAILRHPPPIGDWVDMESIRGELRGLVNERFSA